ncbi:uncharacterized protein LOC134232212 [Saccostrea cucullata]|uniref:uncharacterized protein LOC134232212 n=1 Tax=Saccostrea cuccullata TaxID=36930 RepID=UPI002ED68F83
MDKDSEPSSVVITSSNSNNDDLQENQSTTLFVDSSTDSGNTSPSSNSDNMQPQTPPPAYTLTSADDAEEDAALLDLKKGENNHNDAVRQSSSKDNFESFVQMEHSEKVHMLLGESNSNEKNVDSVNIELERRRLIYKVSQRPPLSLLLFFSLQQSLIVLPSIVKATMLVAEVMCARDEEEFKVQLMSMSLLLSGMCTFLQNSIGFRREFSHRDVSLSIHPSVQYMLYIRPSDTFTESLLHSAFRNLKILLFDDQILISDFPQQNMDTAILSVLYILKGIHL